MIRLSAIRASGGGDRAGRWIAFFALIALAWAALLATVAAGGGYASVYGDSFWRSLCAADAGPGALFSMWALMAAAMMAPAAAPMLATYDGLIAAGAGTRAGFWALAAGYLAVWLGFAAAASLAQGALSQAGLLGPDGASVSPWFSAGLLALAGAYQFSALKQACLRACRAPLTAFMARWRPGAAAAFGFGLREGAFCLGCCWALMALAFVGGTMNLVFMGGAMVLMILEKLPEPGRWLTPVLGWGLLAAAAATAGRALAAHV